MKTMKSSSYSTVRKNLSRDFIEAYLLDCRLREVSGDDEDEDYETSEDIHLPPMNPFNADLKAGQIRLLSQTDELTYAVLLRRWGDNAFVVAPFSRFSSPATDEELRTHFDGGLCLQVLQLWNVRTALDATLKKSWLIGEMPVQDVEDAWKVWEWTLGGAELPEEIAERTGVPVWLRSDPRVAYRNEDFAKFARFDAEDERHASFLDFEPYVIFPKAEHQVLAAEGPKETEQVCYEISGKCAYLQVIYSPMDDRTIFSVVGEAGGASPVLDGCFVHTAENGELGSFYEGVLKSAGRVADMVILDPDGEFVAVTPVE